ncbi:protein of unknown function [Burkholderia multivorans]
MSSCRLTGYATGLTERDNAPSRFRHRAARFGHRGPAGEASARHTCGLGLNGANVSRVRTFERDPRPARAKVQTIYLHMLFMANASTLRSIHFRFKAVDQTFPFHMKNRIAPIATHPLDTLMQIIRNADPAA